MNVTQPDKWREFESISRGALDFMGWAWPVTAILLGAVVASVVIETRRYRRWPSFQPLWQIVVALNPLAILAVGTVWACENCSRFSDGQGIHHVWGGPVITILVVAQLAAAGWFVNRARASRLCVGTLQALLFWVTLSACFLAGMSVSGDWL